MITPRSACRKQGSSWHNINPGLQVADSSPLLPNLLYHPEKNNVSKGTSRLDKERRFCSNLPLTLSFTGNKQDWPKAKNKLFIWLSQQRKLCSYNTGRQQTFPEANEISFYTGLLKVMLEDGITWVLYIGFLSKVLSAAKESLGHISGNLLKGLDVCDVHIMHHEEKKNNIQFYFFFAGFSITT